MSFSELTATDLNKILLFAVAALFALTFWKMTRRGKGSAGNGRRRRFVPGVKPPNRPRARKRWKKDDGKGDGNDIDTGGDGGD